MREDEMRNQIRIWFEELKEELDIAKNCRYSFSDACSCGCDNKAYCPLKLSYELNFEKLN